ncbi:response regulator [Novipirellula artificiosorum]|uniref:Response regulator rcp1 n=1 Tax=Novipirellula artificiosorum TaxID=2528016 RepID=A0A5C6E150_9BACT|nr:response regulator [Novipirellula artificiosorum]TWU42590.1 Response regulator rcp1 [Novipirellula artificiosorum]
MLAASRVKPMEILLVEDGLMDARVTIHSLRRSQVHHRLTLVRSVTEALQFLNQEGVFARAPQPDLLLLDLNLPDGSGIDVLESMQSGDVNIDSVTTVVLTANEDEGIRYRCRELGVHDYIQKPVHENEFMRVVRDHKRLMVHSAQQLAAVV